MHIAKEQKSYNSPRDFFKCLISTSQQCHYHIGQVKKLEYWVLLVSVINVVINTIGSTTTLRKKLISKTTATSSNLLAFISPQNTRHKKSLDIQLL